MTLGQHIQELRKAAGLSQETLGELLSVSRQAVSKWESDATIPDIDNLIAMSRIFHISIGRLLQLEDEEPPVSEELTDRELKAVEAIVSRYIAEAEKKKPVRSPKRNILLAIAILCLGIIWLQFYTMRQSIAQLQNNMSSINSSVSSQVNSITAQVEGLLTEQSSIISDWNYEISSVDVANQKISISVYFTPKTYTADTTATLVALDLDTGISSSAEAQQENGIFQVSQTLPLSDNLKLTVALDENGVKQSQVLDTLSGIASSTKLNFAAAYEGTFSDSAYRGDIRVQTIFDQVFKLQEILPVNFLPLTGEIELMAGEETLLTLPVDFTALNEEDFSLGVSDVTIYVPFDYSIPADLLSPITAILYVTDALGQTYEIPVDLPSD